MAKTLKQILDGVKSSKIKSKDILGTKPGVDYSPKAGDERKFADKHDIEQHADRAGNGSDVYQATNVKYYMDTDKAAHHGYKSGEDEKVYEEKAKCNMSEEGKMCEVHGMKQCPGKVLKEKPVREELEEGVDLSEGRVVAVKTVMSPRGGEDRYEMQHHGTGKGWHSIIKTHQDGQDLHAMHGFHNVVHVGSEKYVQGKWKTIKHADTKAAGSHKMAEEVEQVDELMVQNYISGAKGKSAEVHKNMNAGNYTVKKMSGGKEVGSSEHDDSSSAHAAAKKHIGEETDLEEKAAVAKSKQTVLVTKKGSKTAGGVMRIKKSEYDPKKHDLAEGDIEERKMSDAEMKKREHIVKGMKKKLSDFRQRYGKRAKDVMYATATKQAMKEDLAQPLIGSMDSTKDKKKKKETEQAPAVTPITLPNFSVDVNTGRNV